MLFVLSPAKSLDMGCVVPEYLQQQTPRLLVGSKKLAAEARKLNAIDLQKLMKVSEKIASLNVERFREFTVPFPKEKTRPALFAFTGDVYQGLEASTLSKEQFKNAEKSLRILSGLYGLLRPSDQMMAYRLEMGTKLKTQYGKNLYEFWGHEITELLNEDLSTHKNKTLVNLASQEYFKAVKPDSLSGKVLDIEFKEFREGKYKIISFYAKKARGMMARWILEKSPQKPEDLKDFDVEGYLFNSKLSKESAYVFTRND